MKPNQVALALLAAIVGVGALLSVIISQNPVTNIATVAPQTQVAQVVQSITMGETNSTLSQQDDNGDANSLIAVQTSLSQTATIQSLSFFVTTASGKLRLGIYDATGSGGGPGDKVAETNEITPVKGWNMASVVTPRSLNAGTYWITYLTNDNNLYFPWSTSGSYRSASLTYGAMPATYPSSARSGSGHAALYATLNFTTTPSTTASPATQSTQSAPATTYYAPRVTSVAVPTVTSTSASIIWTTDVSADTQVYYGTTDAKFDYARYSSHTNLDSTLSTSHSVTLTGLTPNTMYFFQVRSSANSKTGTIAQQFTTSPNTTVTPTINTFTITPSTPVRGQPATLSWTTTGLTSCNIESTGNTYIQQIFGSLLGVVQGASGSITVNIPASVGILNRGTTSTVQLGCYTSQLPNITGTYVYKSVSVTIPAASTVVGDVLPPSVPTNLRVTSVSPTQVNLSWDASTDNVGGTGLQGYKIYINGSFYINSTGTTFQNMGLNPNTTYTYSVAAYDYATPSANVSAQSTSVSTTTLRTVVDTIAPTVTTFTIPATLAVSSVPASVPITSFTATDAVGVAGYLLTTSLTPTPTAATAGWTTSIPTSYTFATAGAKTLYAWAKDAAGNVSSSKSANVTVTVSQPTGTNFYVTSNGTGNGSDWAHAASWSTFTPVRGNTYYVAGGMNYSGRIFTTPNSGTTYINIVKATVANSGSVSGWQASYANQATFSGVVAGSYPNVVLGFYTGYWLFDGQTRDESNWFDGTKYGFAINNSQQNEVQIKIGNLSGANTIGNQFKYIYINAPYHSLPATNIRQYAFDTDTDYTTYPQSQDVLISHCYVYGGNNIFYIRDTIHTIVEYSASKGAYNNDANHGEIFNAYYGIPGSIIRYNKVTDAYGQAYGGNGSAGTAIIATSNEYNSGGFEVYGNVFSNFATGDAVIGYSVSYSSGNKVYNNTFINGWGGQGIKFGTGVNNVAYNNLWINSGSGGMFTGVTHDYNGFSGTDNYGEAHAQNGMSSSILTDVVNGNIKSATQPGLNTLGSPYNVDMLGSSRGTDGTWDRGAYEYTGTTPASDTTAPTVTTFTIPATLAVSSVPASVPITALTATDNVGVTGYLLTESLTPTPTTATVGWTTAKPTSYTFATAGTKTLYAWAKDAAGNVSTSKSAGVTVTLGPVSTKFTLNQQVQANAQINVRSTAGNTTSLGTQALNAIGTVIGGPIAAILNAVSYNWWLINFSSAACTANSTSATCGWVAEEYLNTHVALASPDPTVSLSALPTAITSGQSSTLTWSSTNAIACTASGGWTGSKTASNLQTTLPVSPIATTVYTLTCTGALGTSPATASVTVTVGTVSSGRNWFVRPSAIGNGSGSDWNNAAGPSTISNIAAVAGDTIWLAGGTTYTTGMTFSKSGTEAKPIYIKRATANDAAAVNAPGWQVAYDSTVTFQVAATGAANQAAISISGNYVTFDGNTPNGSYGVKVIMGLGAGQAWNAFMTTGNYITITHTETAGRAAGLPAGATTRYLAMYGRYNTSTYNFIHNVTQPYTLNGSNDMTIDHDIVKDNGWHSDIDLAHDDVMEYTGSTNLTVRYSTWENWHAEGIMAWGGFGQAGTIWMYGNTFKKTGVSIVWPSSNSQKVAGPLYFYNNTVIDGYVCLDQSANVPWAAGSVSRNNIYWGTDVYGGPWNWSSGVTRDHEFGSTANLAGNGVGSISNGSNPFVNFAGGDYHIVGTVGATYPKDKGASLNAISGQTINVDRDGTTRGADGLWDIGAYEFH